MQWHWSSPAKRRKNLIDHAMTLTAARVLGVHIVALRSVATSAASLVPSAEMLYAFDDANISATSLPSSGLPSPTCSPGYIASC